MDKDRSIVGQSAEHQDQMQSLDSIGKLAVSVVETVKGLKNHEVRLSNLEDTMRVNGVQENNLTRAVNRSIVAFLGSKESPAYQNNSIRNRAYSEINKEIKDKFGIPRRGELPRKEYSNAMNFIENWIPSFELKDDVEAENRQLPMF